MATPQRWIALSYDPKRNTQPDVREYTLYGGGEGDPSNEGEVTSWIRDGVIPPLGDIRMTREQEAIWFRPLGLADFNSDAGREEMLGRDAFVNIFWVSD